jgi:membrane-associated phospholipid phosphatase
MKKSLLLFILLSAPAYAQSTANTWSNVAVYSAIGLDTVDSFQHEDKKHALTCQGIRLGVANGANILVKHFVHKRRPDGSDYKSFYSNHTSNAAVSSGWKWEIGIPLAIGTGGLRIAAKKHDWIDVTVGMLAGVGSQFVCNKDK